MSPTTFPSSRFRGRRLALAAAVVAIVGFALAGCASESAGSATPSPQATSVSAVTPSAGSVIPSGTVTITGTGLDEVKSVEFGAEKAAIYKETGSDKLVVTAPAAADYQPGAVNVTLLGAGGKTLTTEKAAYSYTATTPVAKQLQYALQYWQNYNTAAYGNLNSVGGDCANFVSQSLVARGWAMNSQWYSKDANATTADWGSPWGYAPAMNDYFADNASSLGLQKLTIAQRNQVALGDIAFFTWAGDTSIDHVEIVDKITKTASGQNGIDLASHNDDFDYRDLDQTITQTHPGATVFFWHLTK